MDILEEVGVTFDSKVVYIILGLFIPLIIYKYYSRNGDYWTKRGIPCEKPSSFFAFLKFIFTSQNLEEMEIERYNRLGRIYGTYLGSNPELTVAEPELLRNIFVKDFQYFTYRREFSTGDSMADKMLSLVKGDDWKRIRTIISPTFSTGKIKKVMGIFQECSKTLIKNLKTDSSKGEPSDVLRLYGAFTMDVIVSSAFSTKIDSHNDPENVFIKHARAFFSTKIGLEMLLCMIFPKFMKMLGKNFFDPESIEFFKKVTLEIIETRKRTGQTRNDFLQLLIDTATASAEEREEKEEEGSKNSVIADEKDSQKENVLKNVTSKKLSMEELIAQCVSFFIGGYHTTATTVSIATYLVALDENVQDKIFKEIDEVLSETNGELEYEAIQKMKYLDCVISETLRMYSPLIRIERTAEADYKLGDTGITIPKGMVIGIPVFAMHRDPEFYPDPETFRPERFSSEEKEKQIPYTYLPFGVGPRNCIAMRFALMEIKVCLVYVLSVFQVKKCSQTKIPIEICKGIGLIQPESVILDLVPRSKCPLKY